MVKLLKGFINILRYFTNKKIFVKISNETNKKDGQKNLTNTQIMILGITSLWLIIPSIYGLFLNINNVNQNINTYNIIYIINIVICVYISIVSIVSTIYWYK